MIPSNLRLSPTARRLLEPLLGVDATLPGVVIGSTPEAGGGATLTARSPIDGATLATGQAADPAQVGKAISAATDAFSAFRLLPAPRRGELVRRYGEALRAQRDTLAEFVTLEAGKIVAEARGEVQEMIDICDFAVGLSRQLYGRTMASERPEHRLLEQWLPLGPVGVISAFNFPVAVWAWNATLAFVCGDPVIWKPSEKTPLCALACHQLLQEVIAGMEDIPPAVATLAFGRVEVGEALTGDRRVPLVSATGSVPMGRAVAVAVGQRLGRTILELGGNNAAIVAPSADLELVVRGAVFAAAGTCGQRCTTLRRLILHHTIFDRVATRLAGAYASLPIGDPGKEGVLVGPLIDEAAGRAMQKALETARAAGATITGGERLTTGVPDGGCYVRPALVTGLPADHPLLSEETFAPILYLLPYETLDEAIALHNAVPQGLASALFSDSVREAEQFLSPAGSDCGIANINIGTSGAEIGGAFGGEKETGGGRESGSDAWKAYMRRQTITINGSSTLPLAQGIRFDLDQGEG